MTDLPEAFFTLHRGLLREGPGDAESLSWALHVAGTTAKARILDAGCGPGADLALMRAMRPAARLVAIDLHAPFIARIQATHPYVLAEVADMLAPPGQFDLIWSAGSAYGPGVQTALSAWRPHLSPGGAVAFSDCLWRIDCPSAVAQGFWAQDYPAMTDLPGHLARIAAAGYRVLDGCWLSKAAWAAYYDPLAARVAALRPGADIALTEVLDATEVEINLWRSHGAEYGYYLSVVALS